MPIPRSRDMEPEHLEPAPASGRHDERSAAPLVLPRRSFRANESAELVADLIGATGLIPADRLALVRGRAARGSFSEALVDEGLASSEGDRAHARRAPPAAARRPPARRCFAGRERADPPACPPAGGGAPLPSRGRRPVRRDRRSAERAGDRRAPACDALPARASRRAARRDRRRARPDRPRLGGRRRVSRRILEAIDSSDARRPRGGGRGHRGADRPHRQLDHPPGRRGRRQRPALRGAGGRSRRAVPHRRRPARGAADPARASPPA